MKGFLFQNSKTPKVTVAFSILQRLETCDSLPRIALFAWVPEWQKGFAPVGFWRPKEFLLN